MTGPAAITAIRAPTDLLRKEVELDAPSSASPSMRQKPPKGRIRILYSVSPLVREKIFGPMPTANSCTQMPFFFAIIKCPNSCAITRTPRSIMVINNEEMFSTSRQIYQKRTDCAYALAHASASSKSSNVYLYLTVYRPFYQRRNLQKRQLSLQKTGNCNLICTIQHGRHCSACFQGTVCQRKAAEGIQIGLFKGQMATHGKIYPRKRAFRAFGIRQLQRWAASQHCRLQRSQLYPHPRM